MKDIFGLAVTRVLLLLAVVNAASIDPDLGKQKKCALGMMSCGPAKNCVNLASSNDNCAACGRRCSSGLQCCNGVCVNPSTAYLADANNCGMCANRCDPGLTCCGGKCVNTASDSNNCNGCGQKCDSGLTCCGGSCKDTTSDSSNCGGCGIACGNKASCCGSTCRKDSDFWSDNNNCGGCAPAIGRVCGTGQRCCNGTCVNTDNNLFHCGVCGNKCDKASQLCFNGACTTCLVYGAECTPAGPGPGCCFGKYCTYSASTSNYKCTSSNSIPPAFCMSQGGPCTTLPCCPDTGLKCTYGFCSGGCSQMTESCTADSDCCSFGLPLACCSGTCSSIGTSMDCGKCGVSCNGTDMCVNGVCTPVAPLLASVFKMPSSGSLASSITLPLAGEPPISTCAADGVTPAATTTLSCVGNTTAATYRLAITPAHLAALPSSMCLKVSLCGMAVVPNVQLDMSWVMPDSFGIAPPGAVLSCGSKNCPNGSLYSQILIWPSGSATGEVVNIQSIGSSCLANLQVVVSGDPDCNIAT